MYQGFIKRQLVKQFAHLSAGDYELVLRGVDDNVQHRPAGHHPLSGERHTEQALRLWFQRLFHLYRSLVFEVHSITSSGWPWDLRAAAEWSATVTPVRGPGYVNRGVHLIRIRRGRVTQLYAYEEAKPLPRHARRWQTSAWTKQRRLPSKIEVRAHNRFTGRSRS
jgi:ketosteroid isomerase-like protein